MSDDATFGSERGSSPVGRGGAGVFIEGELGAFYLLAMLAGTEPRGLPGSTIQRVRFQGVELGFALDDIIIHGASHTGDTLLEIQSKRDISFAPQDPVFKDVCNQIARSSDQGVPNGRHRLAVATQRTSKSISGPYQDVLEWARAADSGAELFARLSAKGVASPAMRTFGETFRSNLVAAGVADDDDTIWKIMRRFLIQEFDFESNSSLARTHAQLLAQMTLAAEDASRAGTLWNALISKSLETAKSGGSLVRDELRSMLVELGFHLAGDRCFSVARAKLTEASRQSLAEIGTSVGGVSIPRVKATEAVNTALDGYRWVQIKGGPGVGKSAVLKAIAERAAVEAHVLFLDPVNTPEGGWGELALRLGVTTTAKEFLTDLAVSGGGTLFVDSLEMFISPARQRTVNDLLREIAAVEGFAFVATARMDYGVDGTDWLAPDAIAKLGQARMVTIGELDEDEVDTLRKQTPELRAILASGHPAAPIARNLYRLSRLLKVPASATIRTEAALAESWWKTGDYAQHADRRAAQRLMADLADAALAGRDHVEERADSGAREHLLRSQTLGEPKRDQLAFYHDVLRDWAIGARLHEDRGMINILDLSVPASPRLARGIEFAGRFALELNVDGGDWLKLMGQLSSAASHGSWRRHALLAIVRSELSSALLERSSAALLADDGALLIELSVAIAVVETISSADLIQKLPIETQDGSGATPTFRFAATMSAPRLLGWCLRHAGEIPAQAISSIVKLVETLYLVAIREPTIGGPAAAMLFGWLMQLDVRGAEVAIPGDKSSGWSVCDDRRRMISDLRTLSLLLSPQAPKEAKAYLKAIAGHADSYKVKEIRPLSSTIVRAAPQELADLVLATLIQTPDKSRSRRKDRALGLADTDYMPSSPAQPPFLDLLEASPSIGLALVRRLVDESVAFRSRGTTSGANGLKLVFDDGPRFFPWLNTYYWSRNQASEYSMESGLMALEAWAHGRIEAGEDIAAVVADVLGPKGSCAAYVLVAIDVLLSHWPASRDVLVPFVSCPELLAIERQREVADGMMTLPFSTRGEPRGRVRLADLRAKASRGIPLEKFLPGYLDDDEASRRVRTLLGEALAKIEPYGERADFSDPAFMGTYALNMLDVTNWVPTQNGLLTYQSPPKEAEHLSRLGQRHAEQIRAIGIESRIQSATLDASQSSAEVARDAAEYADGALPSIADEDVAEMGSTRLVASAMLVARDGDDELLRERETWVRDVIAKALTEEGGHYLGNGATLAYNRQALATLALIHLWLRRRLKADRDALLSVATRSDRCGALAFGAALDVINRAEPRLLKSVLRVAFKACRWRWHPWDEDQAETAAFERQKATDNSIAVDAEVAWLDGACEPSWPAFPDEELSVREPTWVGIPTEPDADEDTPVICSEPVATVHTDSQAAAFWLTLITGHAPRLNWSSEIVDAYVGWSAKANGLGYPRETEVDRKPDEWNLQFYGLVADDLMVADQDRFDELLKQIEDLPDHSFGDVAETIIHSADVWYFNAEDQPADRSVVLRERLVVRAMNLRRWKYALRPGDLSIDYHTGGIVAKLLMNSYDPFAGTRSYLVPSVFDRVDPLLNAIRPMMAGGPTPFIALCTMNTLLVAPRARHLDFLLSAAEAWLAKLPADKGLWIELGIGRRIVMWFNSVAETDSTLHCRAHSQRSRMDALIGRLVSLGVAEAHEFEKRAEER